MKVSTAFVILLVHASLGTAAELFVAPAPLGSDTNPGTRDQPKADVQQVIWSLKPGDTLTLLPSTYTKTYSFAKSGTAEAPITVRGDASGTVIAGKSPGYLTEGRSISTGIQLANERPFHGHPNPSADNLIEENIVVGAKAALYYGEYQKGGGLKRIRFERNTFVDDTWSCCTSTPVPVTSTISSPTIAACRRWNDPS